ncbi:MAG: asparagine synthase (glutamine-hydrolyzing) [Defluviitaleaceae bacterium]|nr:asparagine synthase (glutamine-hydrolyzing) [Defluviitaleaceae bacterium]
MSGIGGFLGYGGTAISMATVCEAMLTSLKKRGQNEHGTFISEDVCLLHTSNPYTGRGPLRAVLGQKAYILVFDGELYNKDELIQELKKLGYYLPDASDGAIVLYSYIAWGEVCVERLLGVFAFAVWDGGRLFVARDRLGLKPFFYATGPRGFAFASDTKTLLMHPNINPVMSLEGVADMMLIGPAHTPGTTFFRDIKELQPGHSASYTNSGGLSICRYWQLKAKPHSESFEETSYTVRKILKDAIARQTANSPELGVFLSGGLDSSAITALSGCKDTFSVDYVGNDKYFTPNSFQPDDDNSYIKEMVTNLRAHHTRVVLGSDELAEALTSAMQARGLPGMGDVDSALLLFCQNVRESVPIALTGEGADEIFGGYPWYQQDDEPTTFPWSRDVKYRSSFIAPHILGRFDPQAYIHNRFEEAITAAGSLYDDDAKERQVRRMFHLNLDWFLPNLATRNESMSAFAGLTVRSPFLDHRLVEYLYNVPWTFKNHNDREKGLLREALKGLLPESVLWRKKSPFPKTHNPAYMSKVTDMIRVVEKDAPLFTIISRDAINRLITEEAGQPWYGQLMRVPQTIAYFLQIDAWMKEYGVVLSI